MKEVDDIDNMSTDGEDDDDNDDDENENDEENDASCTLRYTPFITCLLYSAT